MFLQEDQFFRLIQFGMKDRFAASERAVSGGRSRDWRVAMRLKIAGMFLQEDQFFRLIQFGMKDAAERAGAELLLASSDGKLDKEIQLVNTYIAARWTLSSFLL